MLTVVLAVTADVVIVNAGDTDAPCTTITDVGTAALGLPLVSITTTPPDGAGPFRLTVPVVERPPLIAGSDNVTIDTASGMTDKFAGVEIPL